MINVLNPNATMNDEAGPCAGLDRDVCPPKNLAHLQGPPAGGAGGRGGEPILSEQWFVKMKPLAEPAMEVVRNGTIRFIPERFSRVYFNWMENIRDWGISRQLWWGH